MSEIYRNTVETIRLDITGTTDAAPTAVATTSAGDTSLPVTRVADPSAGVERWEATLNYAVTSEVGEVPVTWTFSVGGVQSTRKDFYDVVAPLVSLEEMQREIEILGPVDDNNLLSAERKVRNYIEVYTGQVFAPSTETIVVRTDSNRFLLPKRLISVTETNPSLLDGYELVSDGFAMKLVSPIGYDYPGVISAPGYYDVKRDIPYTYNTRYRTARELSITGRWGWERVPVSVKEAALILIEGFISPDGAYRDKYLESLTSPDWRIQFHSGAFEGTGNVRVDQLLANYVVKSKWEIV